MFIIYIFILFVLTEFLSLYYDNNETLGNVVYVGGLPGPKGPSLVYKNNYALVFAHLT